MKNNSGILVVDDDENLLRTLSDILRNKGYEVVTATTGAEGIAAAKRACVNVALIDLKLPDMPGIEVMREIKSSSSLTEVIILTGHASLGTAVEAINRDAFSYLLKPYDIDQLLHHIHRAIDRQKTQLKILQLASFPRMDPNPVIEVNAAGEITYLNPAAEKFFPELDVAHLIPASWNAIQPALREVGQNEMTLEVKVENVTFEQHLYRVPGSDIIRIQMRDITERKQAEARIAEQLDELNRWNAILMEREMRIMEVKREVNELLRQAGQPVRYHSVEDDSQQKK